MDRFTRGFVAGVVASMLQFLVSIILYTLDLTDLLWLDFASVMIYGRRPVILVEQVFAELSVFFFSGLMGVIFAYLIANIGSRNYLFKGFVFSEFIWFGSFAITILFKVTELEHTTFKTSVSNFVMAAIWGFITAEILRRLGERKDVRD